MRNWPARMFYVILIIKNINEILTERRSSGSEHHAAQTHAVDYTFLLNPSIYKSQKWTKQAKSLQVKSTLEGDQEELSLFTLVGKKKYWLKNRQEVIIVMHIRTQAGWNRTVWPSTSFCLTSSSTYFLLALDLLLLHHRHKNEGGEPSCRASTGACGLLAGLTGWKRHKNVTYWQ